MARNDTFASTSRPGDGARQRAGQAAAAGHGYHRWARDMLRCLDQLTAGIAVAHADRDARLPELRETYRLFERRLRRQLAWEDMQLFPLLAALDQGGSASTAAARDAVGELRLGDAELGQILTRLAELSDDFAAPRWASLDHRLMLDQLGTLAAETRAHLHGQQQALLPQPDEC
jgi:iron-sulfur cluster repair protein YtfE (RIC family)